MVFRTYVSKNFAASSLAIIEQANVIINEYSAQGFDLTLRQLYYQFVSRGLAPNTDREYKRLGSIINDGRLAGMISWTAIEDRTRNVRGGDYGEDSVADFVDGIWDGYTVTQWEDQPHYVEVWIEKDALIGVFEGICSRYRLPLFSCRGYTSQSEMWRAGQRIGRKRRDDLKMTRILHFGDHDPSGIDMTRDIQDRLDMFGAMAVVERLALTMDQVDEYQPPPNPAKVTDSRAAGYIAEYGDQSWELDALDPATLAELVENAVTELIVPELWQANIERAQEGRDEIKAALEGVLD